MPARSCGTPARRSGSARGVRHGGRTLGTCAARRAAGHEGRAQHYHVGLGLASGDAAGGHARVGAVEVEANATHHVGGIGLREVGVGADHAGCRAVGARLHTARDCVAIADGRLRVGLEHLLNVHGFSSRVVEAGLPPRPSRSANALSSSATSPASRGWAVGPAVASVAS